MVTIPKPKPPTCESCGAVIDTNEDYLGDDVCPENSFGHFLGYHGIVQLIRYLEAEDDTAS